MGKAPFAHLSVLTVTNVDGKLVPSITPPKTSSLESGVSRPLERGIQPLSPEDMAKLGVLKRIPHIELRQGQVQGIGNMLVPTLEQSHNHLF